MRYSEIHFHLLPGVDDGPKSVQESLDLAALAVADGTSTIVATPHVHPQHITDPMEIAERAAELSTRLRENHIPVEVLPGGELSHHMVGRLAREQLEAIAQGPEGRRWLLLEAPFHGIDDDYTNAADDLRNQGFAIVVAHPERAAQIASTERAIEYELGRGSVFQLTAWSFVGRYGDHVRALARRLLRRAPGSVIASDAHGRDRMPSLSIAVAELRSAGERDAERYAGLRPQTLLNHGLTLAPAARAA
jgi:protein-tyrosine phosphatase